MVMMQELRRALMLHRGNYIGFSSMSEAHTGSIYRNGSDYGDDKLWGAADSFRKYLR